ncbi:MAG: DUF1553 domain-containing protein [Verrucomicrobiota bacterium]
MRCKWWVALRAEAIRDSALQVAGLLRTTESIPLHSFFPYQPDPYWTRSDKVMYGSRHLRWATSTEASQHQRSLYTFWKRQNIHPMMLAFDAPTRQECTPQRNITNTPAQALALLNDPIFLEAAVHFAQTLLDSPSDTGGAKSDAFRLEEAFRRSLQRTPTEAESDILLTLLDQLRDHYRERPDESEQLLRTVSKTTAAPANPTELAAWTGVTRSLLNLHEFLTRP